MSRALLRTLVAERFPKLSEELGPMPFQSALLHLGKTLNYPALDTWVGDKSMDESIREIGQFIEDNDLREDA